MIPNLESPKRMLWCGILARMRSQWDALEAPEGPQAPTHRVNARGTRTEFFDLGVCFWDAQLAPRLLVFLRGLAHF